MMDVMSACRQLHDFWSTCTYGIPYDGGVMTPDAPDWEEHYRFQSYDEFVESKCGICWDYTNYGRHFFMKQHIPFKQYFMMCDVPGYASHTYILCDYGEDDKVVLVESAFKAIDDLIDGIKVFDNFREATRFVAAMQFANNGLDKKVESFKYDVIEFRGHPNYHCTGKEYVAWMYEENEMVYQSTATITDYHTAMDNKEPVSEAFVEYVLSSEDKKDLKDDDFGIPELRKYPLVDAEHVKMANSFFGYAPAKYKAELAKRILDAADKMKIDTSNWKKVHDVADKHEKAHEDDNGAEMTEEGPVQEANIIKMIGDNMVGKYDCMDHLYKFHVGRKIMLKSTIENLKRHHMKPVMLLGFMNGEHVRDASFEDIEKHCVYEGESGVIFSSFFNSTNDIANVGSTLKSFINSLEDKEVLISKLPKHMDKCNVKMSRNNLIREKVYDLPEGMPNEFMHQRNVPIKLDVEGHRCSMNTYYAYFAIYEALTCDSGTLSASIGEQLARLWSNFELGIDIDEVIVTEDNKNKAKAVIKVTCRHKHYEIHVLFNSMHSHPAELFDDEGNKMNLKNSLNKIFKKKDKVVQEAVDLGKKSAVYFIFVSEHKPVMSNLIRKITDTDWTHAGIAFDSSLRKIYTFAMQSGENYEKHHTGVGFALESIVDYANRRSDDMVSVVAGFVDNETIRKMQETIEDFKVNTNKTVFSWGTIAKFLIGKDKGTAKDRKYVQVCSSFVDYVMNAADLKVTPEGDLVSPESLRRGVFTREDSVREVYNGLAAEYDQTIVDEATDEFAKEEATTVFDSLYQLRPATDEDKENMYNWEMESIDDSLKEDVKVQELIREDVESSIKDTRMIMHGTKTIGMITACMIDDGEYRYIGELYIIPEYRGKGIGTDILKKELEAYDKVKLQVAFSNTRAVKLYKSLGFKIVDTNHEAKMYIMSREDKPVQEMVAPGLIKVNELPYDTLYFGSDKDFGDNVLKLSKEELFLTPFMGIASIFTTDRTRYELPHGYNVNLAYDEWHAEDTSKPFEEIHVTIEGLPDYRPRTFQDTGYIYAIDVSELKDHIYRREWMDPSKEFLLCDVNPVPIHAKTVWPHLVHVKGGERREKPDVMVEFSTTNKKGKLNNLITESCKPLYAEDRKNGVNPKSKNLVFHISDKKDLDEGKPLEPRVPTWIKEVKDPEKTMKDTGRYEDIKTPRVCFSPSISGCLNAIINMTKLTEPLVPGKQLYVYVPEKPLSSYKKKSNKDICKDGDVFDANVTGEMWILEPVKLKFYGSIAIDSVKDNGKSYPVTTAKTSKEKRDWDNQIGAYIYKWHWVIDPSVAKHMEKWEEIDKKHTEKKKLTEAFHEYLYSDELILESKKDFTNIEVAIFNKYKGCTDEQRELAEEYADLRRQMREYEDELTRAEREYHKEERRLDEDKANTKHAGEKSDINHEIKVLHREQDHLRRVNKTEIERLKKEMKKLSDKYDKLPNKEKLISESEQYTALQMAYLHNRKDLTPEQQQLVDEYEELIRLEKTDYDYYNRESKRRKKELKEIQSQYARADEDEREALQIRMNQINSELKELYDGYVKAVEMRSADFKRMSERFDQLEHENDPEYTQPKEGLLSRVLNFRIQ